MENAKGLLISGVALTAITALGFSAGYAWRAAVANTRNDLEEYGIVDTCEVVGNTGYSYNGSANGDPINETFAVNSGLDCYNSVRGMVNPTARVRIRGFEENSLKFELRCSGVDYCTMTRG